MIEHALVIQAAGTIRAGGIAAVMNLLCVQQGIKEFMARAAVKNESPR